MRREQRLFAVRWYLALLDFERQAYGTPSGDLSRLYWDKLQEYLLIPAHPEIPVWAQIPHLVTHPVYVQNYMVADLIAAQLRSHLREAQGGILDHPETADYLHSNLLRHGARYRTGDLLMLATGARLTPHSLGEELLGRPSPGPVEPGLGPTHSASMPSDD
jgi:oligoendopeptidase F